MSYRWIIVLILLFYSFSFIFRTDGSFDQDLGRHLKLGEIIINTKSVPKTNLFSYTNPDFPFINHHFLFEILVYLGQKTLGLTWLLVFKIIILLTAISITVLTVKKQYWVLLLPISYLFLHVTRERVELRPEIFSFLFTSLTIYILEQFSKSKSRLVFLLPLIQLVWVNTHIYFPVGFILQGIYLVDFLWRRELGKAKFLTGIFLGAGLVSLLNPNFIRGLLYPLTIFGNYGYTIVENQTIFLLESIGFSDHNFLFVKLSILLILASLLAGYFKKTLEVKNILLCLFSITLALLHMRSFPYLFFIGLPAIVTNFGEIKFNLGSKILLTISIFLLFYESNIYLNGDYYRYTFTDRKVELAFTEHGRTALDFLIAKDLPQPIFNNFDIGSYIFYRGYPKVKVFVDGRPEAYPKEFFQETYIPAQLDKEKFEQLFNNYHFQTIVFSHTDQTPWAKQFLVDLSQAKDWKLVYLDDFMVIYVRSVSLGKLTSINLNEINVKEFNFSSSVQYLRLAFFFQNINQPKLTREFFDKSVQLFKDSPIIYPQNKPWW